MATPYYDMTKEVHVMLVDHNKEFVTQMVDLIEPYAYKVTTVDTTSTAMTMLSKEKKKIDVMIINVHSDYLRSFQLLAQAVALDIISLIICDEHSEFLAKKALNDGAYLYLKKPLNEEIVEHLWQFVFRKKIQREKARQRIEENEDWMNADDVDYIGNNNIVGDEDQNGEKNISNNEEQRNNIHKAENNVVSNEKYKLRRKRGRKNTKEINEAESQINANNKVVRQKMCIEWTVDLHNKFAEAVQQLGEGRCYPKEILEMMNVPGLTKMQVASHLQKCRANNWKALKAQKIIHQPSDQGFSSSSQQKSNFRRFGIMPHLQTNISNLRQQQCNADQIQRGLEFPFPTLNSNNIFTEGESSTHQLYRPQLQVQSHYFNVYNPFKNSFLLAQNNASGLQHETLFKMLSSQGLQDITIGNTNYRPLLACNNGDHHNQNDYNLNLNADLVTTYPGSTIMPDTNIESATINELEAVNANFQQYIGEPNMSNPNIIIATSHASDTEESDSKERKNCDAYFNFNNTNYLFQNLGASSANLPNEHGSEFDQIYSADQVASTPNVQFSGISNFSNESST